MWFTLMNQLYIYMPSILKCAAKQTNRQQQPKKIVMHLTHLTIEKETYICKFA